MPGEWNAVGILARGPLIQTWINGAPAATILDAADARGHIALQVHGVRDTSKPLAAHFRNIRIRKFVDWSLSLALNTATLWVQSSIATPPHSHLHAQSLCLSRRPRRGPKALCTFGMNPRTGRRQVVWTSLPAGFDF